MVKRLLKNKGVFIIFDGFSGKKESLLTKEEILAKKLTEKSMLVPSFEHYKNFKDTLVRSGFKVIEEEDVSLLIMPTLKRFETQARLYFKIPPFILRVINKFFSPVFINNVISGYLLSTLEELKVSKYMILVVSKEN